MNDKKTLLILIIALALGALGLFYFMGPKEQKAVERPEPTAPEPQEPQEIESTPSTQKQPQIKGSVIFNETGRAASKVNVRLLRKAKLGDKISARGGEIPVRHWFLEKTKTNFAGRFSFNGIAAGDYFLEAEKEGYATTLIPLTVFDPKEKLTPQIKLPTGASLLIEVKSDQRLIGGHAILLHPGEDPRVGKLDENHQVMFTDLSPGMYWFRLEPSLASLNLYHWQSFNAQFPKEIDIQLEEGEAKEWSVSFGGKQKGRLTGVLQVQGADSSEEFIVTARLTNLPIQVSRYPVQNLQVTIKNGQAFTFENTPSGKYLITVTPTGGQSHILGSKNIHVAGKETRADFSFQVGFVKGRLEDQKGQPGRQKQISLQRVSEEGQILQAFSMWSDENGRFASKPLPAGSYAVKIQTYHGKPIEDEIVISEGVHDMGIILFQTRETKQN